MLQVTRKWVPTNRRERERRRFMSETCCHDSEKANCHRGQSGDGESGGRGEKLVVQDCWSWKRPWVGGGCLCGNFCVWVNGFYLSSHEKRSQLALENTLGNLQLVWVCADSILGTGLFFNFCQYVGSRYCTDQGKKWCRDSPSGNILTACRWCQRASSFSLDQLDLCLVCVVTVPDFPL